MFYTIVVMLKCAAGVVGWIDEDTLHLASKLLLQRLQGEQVVTEDQAVVKDVFICHAGGSVV